MALFEFELARVEDIPAWSEGSERRLTWFALTWGTFRIHVGEAVLFRYSEAALAHLRAGASRDAEYQVAALARDVLGCVMPGVARLPERIERLAENWDALAKLVARPLEDEVELDDRLEYQAWRWLGERSPWTSYLAQYPNFCFLRVGERVHVCWDNRERRVEGMPLWSAQQGFFALEVDEFLAEARSFADRLLEAMAERISGIEGRALDASELRRQHETWRAEFAGYFGERAPDIPWQETEAALEALGAFDFKS
jgi:hypothetical protein